jgi:rhamnosyltransferase
VKEFVAMSAQASESDSRPIPAASVLYRPDAAQLNALLRALDREGRHLFLFINGPLEEIIESEIAGLANAHVIRSTENIGLGAGLNAVCEAAGAEGFAHILLFDQDSAPEPGLAGALFLRFSALEGRGDRPAALGPLLITPPEGNYRPVRYFWRQRAAGTVDFVPTSGSLISLTAWRAIGPFRADYFVGGIDVEWGFRAWRFGYACVVAQDIRMVHRWGAGETDAQRSAPQILRQSDVRTYLYLRNAVDCMRLPHIPRKWKGRFALTLLTQIGVLLSARGFGASTRGLVWRALRDGWRDELGPPPRDLTAD